MSIIIGIDPGSIYTGYGLIEVDYRSNKAKHIDSGRIACGRGAFQKRLQILHKELSLIMQNYQPDMVAIEDVFVQKNPMSALKLGHARGVVILACMREESKIYEYSPRQIKKTVTGYGAAEKKQVQFMIRAMLGLTYYPVVDAADALAVALTHMAYANNPISALDSKER